MDRKRWIIISLLMLIIFSNCFAGCINEEKNNEIKKNGEYIEETNSLPIIKETKKIVGLVNEEVTFNVIAFDYDGWIILYEWDFNGDGIFDWNSTENGNTTYTYLFGRVFYANFSVTDNNGSSNHSIITVIINERMLLPDPELYITFPSNNQTVNGTINITGYAEVHSYIDEPVTIEISVTLTNETFGHTTFSKIHENSSYKYNWYNEYNTEQFHNETCRMSVHLKTNKWDDVVREIHVYVTN